MVGYGKVWDRTGRNGMELNFICDRHLVPVSVFITRKVYRFKGEWSGVVYACHLCHPNQPGFRMVEFSNVARLKKLPGVFKEV